MEGFGPRPVSGRLQSRSEESPCDGECGTFTTRGDRRQYLGEGSTHRGDYGRNPKAIGATPSKMTNWSTIALGELLRRSDETVEPVADREYREVTVRLWGKGVNERGRVLGADLAGRRFVTHAGQFIASRIDARHGATGLIPRSLEGALVTNDFPLFDIDHSRLYGEFFGWLSRTETFIDLCRRASEGTTNRVRLRKKGCSRSRYRCHRCRNRNGS